MISINNQSFHSSIQFTFPVGMCCEHAPTSDHIKPTCLMCENRYPHDTRDNQLNSSGRIRAPRKGHKWLALEIDNVGMHDECWGILLDAYRATWWMRNGKMGITHEVGGPSTRMGKGMAPGFACRAPSDSLSLRAISNWELADPLC